MKNDLGLLAAESSYLGEVCRRLVELAAGATLLYRSWLGRKVPGWEHMG
jgi:hypothetical protein